MQGIPRVEGQQVHDHHAVEQTRHARAQPHPEDPRAQPREAHDVGQNQAAQVVPAADLHNR